MTLCDLSGKRVLITEAGRFMGPALCATFAELGAEVTADDRPLADPPRPAAIIALSQTHVNPLKWLGMAFLGLLTMVSIAMVHVDQTRAEVLAVLIFAAAAAPTAAIILVHGNPFQQPAAVTAEPIAALARSAQ